MKRGQYSLEFLLTYSWAFLAVAIAIAAIYSFGWINIDQILPESCNFYGQTQCVDFEAFQQGGQGTINLILINRFGADLNITDAVISSPANPEVCSVNFSLNEQIRWNNTEQVQLNFRNCDGTNWVPRTRFDGTVNLTFYNPLTGSVDTPHSQFGSLLIYIRDDS